MLVDNTCKYYKQNIKKKQFYATNCQWNVVISLEDNKNTLYAKHEMKNRKKINRLNNNNNIQKHT